MSILTKIKTSSIFFLALIFTALNSCVMYYNTNEIRNNFKKNINQINNIADKAKNDFKNKSNIYKDLSGFIIDRNLEPFKSISQEMKHFDIAFKLSLDGLYIPSFNKSFFHKRIYSKNFIIAGSAHNVKEIKIKEKQNVNLIFLSPIFKIKKSNYVLDIARFNILSKFSKKRIIALGGIKISNFKKLKMTSAFGFSGISHIKKIINN